MFTNTSYWSKESLVKNRFLDWPLQSTLVRKVPQTGVNNGSLSLRIGPNCLLKNFECMTDKATSALKSLKLSTKNIFPVFIIK